MGGASHRPDARKLGLSLKCTTLRRLAVLELCIPTTRSDWLHQQELCKKGKNTRVVTLKVQYLSPK